MGPITLHDVVTDLLTWVGVSKFVNTQQVPSLPLPSFLESVWIEVRRFGHRFFNQAPIASPTITGQDPATGAVTGSLGAVDYEDDDLTYAASAGPLKGELTVDAAGNFEYKPGVIARVAAGDLDATPADRADAFTVVVADAAARTTVTVDVEVEPIDAFEFSWPALGVPGPSAGPVFDADGVAYLNLGTFKTTTPAGVVKVVTGVVEINPVTGQAITHEIDTVLAGTVVISPDGHAYQATRDGLIAFTSSGVKTFSWPSLAVPGPGAGPVFDADGVAYLNLGTFKTTTPAGVVKVVTGVVEINPVTGQAITHEIDTVLAGTVVISPDGHAYQATRDGLIAFTSAGVKTFSWPALGVPGPGAGPVFDANGVAYLNLGTFKTTTPAGVVKVVTGVVEINPVTGQAITHEIDTVLAGTVVISPDGHAYQATRDGLIAFTSSGVKTFSWPALGVPGPGAGPVFDADGVAYLNLGTFKTTTPAGVVKVVTGVVEINPVTGQAITHEIDTDLAGTVVISPDGHAYQATRDGLIAFTSSGVKTFSWPSLGVPGPGAGPVFDANGVAYLNLGTFKTTTPAGVVKVVTGVVEINPVTGQAITHEIDTDLAGTVVISPDGHAYQATRDGLIAFTSSGVKTFSWPSLAVPGPGAGPVFDADGVAYLNLGTFKTTTPSGTAKIVTGVVEINPVTGQAVTHEIDTVLAGTVVISPDGHAYQATSSSLWLLSAASWAL